MQKVERQNSLIYFMGQIYASCGHFSLLLTKSGTFGQLLPASVHLFALLDFGTGCIANIVFSFSCCRFAHLALFSWLSNIQVLLRQNGFCQHHLKYCGYCNYGGGDNYKRALIPRRSPIRRRANCARKWISPWCRKSYHVSLSNETNIQRKPKDENIPKLQWLQILCDGFNQKNVFPLLKPFISSICRKAKNQILFE